MADVQAPDVTVGDEGDHRLRNIVPPPASGQVQVLSIPFRTALELRLAPSSEELGGAFSDTIPRFGDGVTRGGRR